jgi:dTDP-4-amino-4,6-dideoxygalactose transaminase
MSNFLINVIDGIIPIVFMSEDVLEPLNKLLMSGQLTQGQKVEDFESNLKKYLDNPYVLTLNSATAVLTLT